MAADLDMDVVADVDYSWGGVPGWLEMEGGVKALAKLVKQTIAWLNNFGVINKHEQPYANAEWTGRTVKLFCQLTEIPDTVNKIVKSIEKVSDDPARFMNWTKLMKHITNLFNLTKEGILELFWTSMPEKVELNLDKVGFVSLDVGMACLLYETGSDVVDLTNSVARAQQQAQATNGEERTKYERFETAAKADRWNKVIKIAQWVFFFVLGVLGIASLFFAVALAPWMLLACSTSALICSIVGHFHKEHVVKHAFQEIANLHGHGALREYHREGWGKVPPLTLNVEDPVPVGGGT